jgi:tetratricopeptide (TPR) repeat protein
MHYLAVSRAFQGEFEKAREAAHSLLQFRENPRESGTDDNTYSAYAQGWFAMMRVLVQSEDWDRLLDGSTLPEFSRPRHQAWRHWARGVAFAARGELDKAVSERRQMETAMARLFAKTRLRPEELGVARAELDAHILLARGKVDRGLRALDRAGAAERRLVYSEPPFYPRPVYEALGRLALKHNRPRLAEHAFRQALEQYPGSKGAQTGLRAAATALETAAGAP